jgi:molybdate transport system substrate-binding protein
MISPLHFLRPMLIAAVLSLSVPARADEVVVFSTTAAKSAVELIVPEFERATGHKVQAKFGTAAELKGFIEKGASCDVALLTAVQLMTWSKAQG